VRAPPSCVLSALPLPGVAAADAGPVLASGKLRVNMHVRRVKWLTPMSATMTASGRRQVKVVGPKEDIWC